MSSERPCSVPGCGHVLEVQCLLMSIASGGVLRVRHHRREFPDGTVVIDEAFDERPGLWEELQTTVARLDVSGGSAGTGAQAAETPMPYHERASEVARRLAVNLAGWAVVAGLPHTGATAPPAGGPPALARWLASDPDRLAEVFKPGMVEGVRSLVRHAEGVIDRAPDQVYAGPCWEPLGEAAEAALRADPEAKVPRCDGQLYARQGKPFVGCRECGARHDVATRQAWLSTQLGPSLATAAELAPALSWLLDKEIKVDTIHKWKTRGLLAQHGVLAGRPLYRFNEVLDLAREVKTRASKPRGKEGSAA